MIRSIYNPSLTDILPKSVLEDEKLRASAKALDKELAKLSEVVAETLHLPRIDELPENVVDLLGWQFHIENYSTSLPLEKKRELVKTSILVHRRKGTRYAIETVVSQFFSPVEVVPWHDYGGHPYTFRLKFQSYEGFGEDRGIDFLKRIVSDVKSERDRLGYSEEPGISFERTIELDGLIQLGIASLFGGCRHIGITAPEDLRYILNTSIVPARSGILRIGVGAPDRSDPFNFDVGLGQYLGGTITLGVNADDLPDIFREEASRLAPILGYAYVRRGVHRLPLATPEDVLVPFGFGSSIGKSGKRHYGLAPPDGSVMAPILGTATAHNGERRFEHDPNDLPEWFKDILNDSVIQEVIRTADVKTGRNFIGLSPPEQGLVPFTTGFYSGLFGVTAVGADRRDLPPEFAEKVARAVATIGLSVRQQTRRFISLAAPETAKAAFGVGMLQKRSGTVKVPLASPEDAALEQGLGTAAFQNGRRTLLANPDDIPEWFKNILGDAKVAETVITALYTRGRKKASLASVDDARLETKVGMGGAENGRRSVDIDPDDLPEMFKDILDDARVVAQLGIMLKQAGKRSVGLAPVAEPEAASMKTGMAANISGEVAIRADPNDLPDEYKMPEPRAVLMAGVEILEKVWRRIHLEPPEESRAAYSLAITDFTGGRRTILPSMPDDSEADMGVGFADSFGGRRDIGADLDDLPEAFKERSTRLNPLFGVATTHRGNRRVGLAMMLKDRSTTYAGTVGSITGYKVIGADLNDLEPPRKRRILPHAGLVHAGTMAVG